MQTLSAALLASVSIWSHAFSTAAIKRTRTEGDTPAAPSQWPEEELRIADMLEQARRNTIERVGGGPPWWRPQEPVPESLQAVLTLGRNLSFYLGGDVAAFEATRDCANNRFMAYTAQIPMGADEGQLTHLSGALWDNNEYALQNYFVSRLLCGDLVRVYDPSFADLCFPACGGPAEQAERERQRQELREKHGPVKNLGGFDIENIGLVFEVPFHSREKWRDCKNIGLFYEVEERTDDDMQGMWWRCKIMVPYLHGVAQLSEDVGMPYDMIFRKPALLSFVGGTTQGDARGRLLHEMVEYSKQRKLQDEQMTSEDEYAKQRKLQDDQTTSEDLFIMPFDLPHNEGKFWHTAEMYKLVWEQYAASEFSWQPFGDTATRRGFYDSWMFGSIPVLTAATSRYYRQLFRRALMPHLQSVAVLLPEDALVDGPTVIQYVANISTGGREKRRAVMRSVAPVMQWGWKAEGDALITALGLLQMEAPRVDLQGGYGDKYESREDEGVVGEVLANIGDDQLQGWAFPLSQQGTNSTKNLMLGKNVLEQESSGWESVLMPHRDNQSRYICP